ncbi:MAG: Rep family protein [Christensenellaceae bacterium]
MYLKQCEVESRVEFFKGDIQETIKSKKTIKKWAYILHDKDDTAPHYHIYLNFGSSGVDTKQVAEWFGLQESQVNKIRGRATDMMEYLTHGNASQQNKHQYSPTEVIANFDFQTEIKNAKILGDFEHYSYAQQLNYVHSLAISEQVSAYRMLDTLWKNHCKWLSMHTDRNISVMFVTGKGGTGKTYYAKTIMQKRFGDDFCVSSASNDPWQDYLGQRGMILDDARDRNFDNFADFLKLIDNHTSSSVASRFANKVFNGELIIITSSVPLRYWYKGKNSKGLYFSLEEEDFVQLYRRIGCYVEVTKAEVLVYPNGMTDNGCPKGLAQVYKNKLFENTAETKLSQTIDFSAVFNEICEPATIDIFDNTQLKLSDKK